MIDQIYEYDILLKNKDVFNYDLAYIYHQANFNQFALPSFCTISDNLFLYYSRECNRLFIYRIFYNKSYC